MAEENNKTAAVAQPAPRSRFGGGDRQSGGQGQSGDRRRRGPRRDRERGPKDEFDQKIVDLARVTRVMAGGKRMRFRACVVIGDHKGKVGVGLAKSADVSTAISKATEKAKKEMITIQMVNGTIAHAVNHKYGAGRVLLKPAGQGRGIIAGGAVRIVLEMAGLSNVVSKILGTNNPVTNVKCVMEALQMLKHVEDKKGKQGNSKNEQPAEQPAEKK